MPTPANSHQNLM